MTYISKKQYGILEGIAYRVADSNYIAERFGDDEPELKKTRDTLYSLFDEADRAGIPFWVQNTVISYAENWRRYKETYMSSYLENKGIYMEA